MARTKLKRINELKNFRNVFLYTDQNLPMLIKDYFNGAKLFTLEVGCGHGDYSVELAQQFPERNFIGIDVKGARVFNGAAKAVQLKLNNAAFIITKAEKLLEILEPKSVEEIYIPFPDPHPRRSSQDRRLVSTFFLQIYKKLLINDGLVYFKTDNEELYEYALKSILNFGAKIINLTEHLYQDKDLNLTAEISTSFEKHYIKEGRTIKYICFKF